MFWRGLGVNFIFGGKFLGMHLWKIFPNSIYFVLIHPTSGCMFPSVRLLKFYRHNQITTTNGSQNKKKSLKMLRFFNGDSTRPRVGNVMTVISGYPCLPPGSLPLDLDIGYFSNKGGGKGMNIRWWSNGCLADNQFIIG